MPAVGQSWTTYALPTGVHYVSYSSGVYDAVSGKSIYPFNDWAGVGTIYSNSLYAWDSSTHTWSASLGSSGSGYFNFTAVGTAITRTSGINFKTAWVGSSVGLVNTRFDINTVGGVNNLSVVTGSPASSGLGNVGCPQTTSTWYGDRHVTQQFAIDTTRHRLYQQGGPCSVQNVTIGASQDHRFDTWYLGLTGTVTSDTFHAITATAPAQGTPNGMMIYAPNSDVFIHFGYDGGAGSDEWSLFAPTTSGTLSSDQITAGAGLAVADNWVSIAGATLNPAGGLCSANRALCPGSFLSYTGGYTQTPGHHYIPALGKIYLFGSVDYPSPITVNSQWLYNPPTHRWETVTTSHHPPANHYSELYILSYYNSNDGKVYLYDPPSTHLWSINIGDPSPDWTDLGALTGGPTFANQATYDPANNELIVPGCTSCPDDSGFVLNVINPPTTVSFTIPLTNQEVDFPGSPTGHTDTPGSGGVARTNEPVCYGVPIAESTGLTSLSNLNLSVASAGQFRTLGTWPSGRIKWVEVCAIIPTLSAGASVSMNLTNDGTGNFGGSNLATDNGSTITVSTNGGTCAAGSAICFTLKKASHNGLDVVDIGSTHVVLTGTSTGSVIMGPDPTATYPGNVTCLPDSGGSACTTVYSSKNDSSSTCAIEKNGPVQAVVKCTFTYKDSGGTHSYVKGTNRYYFNKGKTAVKVDALLRNADYGTSNTFATAYKGHKGWEFRTGVNISGTTNYSFACLAGTTGCTASPKTGTMSGTDSIYLYQAKAHYLKLTDECSGSSGCIPLTTDNGYSLVKTVSGTPTTLAVDATYTLPLAGSVGPGWADIDNGSGVGVEIGTPYMMAWELKSLEFRSGGTEAVVGLWAPQNSQAYYAIWPQHSQATAFLDFHASAPTSLPDSFLRLQHPLTGRTSISQYNNSGAVKVWKLVDGTTEDAWYSAIGAAASPSISSGAYCCMADYGWGIDHGGIPSVDNYPWWAWGAGSDPTQVEFRWSNILKFWERGWTGRLIDSQFFYKRQATDTFPMCDNCVWSAHSPGETDGFGQPSATSANVGLGPRHWHDQEHLHTWGITDYYFQTGDESIHDSIRDGMKDFWMTGASTFQGEGLLWNRRAQGGYLANGGVLYTYLKAVGDSDAETVLANAKGNYLVSIKQELCQSGYPTGCSRGGNNQGISRKRGATWGPNEYADNSPWCGQDAFSPLARINGSLQTGIMSAGVLMFRAAAGPSWAEYQNSLDLAYGVSRYAQSELFTLGNGTWTGVGNGVPRSSFPGGSYYYPSLDLANGCDSSNTNPIKEDAVWASFLSDYLTTGTTAGWEPIMRLNWQRYIGSVGMNAADFGEFQTATLISYLAAPSTKTLQTLPISSFTDNGGGSYTLGWTTPTSTDYLRVKYAPLQIVDWIGFDNQTNAWIGNPATTDNWFAATDATGIPSPTAGTQSMTVTGLSTGLLAANFSIKGFAPFVCSIAPTTLGPWTIGQVISQTLVASACGSSTFTSSGTWPTGITLSSGGLLSGTVGGSPGTFTPHAIYDIANQAYSIVVNAIPSITTTTLPAGTQGNLYSQTLAVSGGTGASTCALFSGTLSGSGLTLNSNCVINGMAGTPAIYTFTAKATDSNGIPGSTSSSLSITINAGSGIPSLTIGGGVSLSGGH